MRPGALDPRDVLDLVARSSASGATARAARHGSDEDGGLSDDEGLVHVAHLPARRATTVDLPAMDEALAKRLRWLGIESLYSHQAEAIDLVRQGRHTIVATGTASGKSLAYQVPVIDTLLGDDTATALYLAPTKALARDQLRAIRDFRLPQVRAAAIDGDTPLTERDAIKRTANLLLTNPDLLHHSVLPGHRHWGDFLHRLRYVIVDEAHTARGVFGSHVALVLRRLRRLLERYDAHPVFVLASATVGNPAEHATRLVGMDVEEVVGDGSSRGPLDLGLWQPPFDDRDEGRRRSLLAEVGDLLASFVAAGTQTLVFTGSRKAAEVIAGNARDRSRDDRNHGSRDDGGDRDPGNGHGNAGDRSRDDRSRDSGNGDGGGGSSAAGEDGEAGGGPFAGIFAYRAGLLPSERRELEEGLRDGSVRGLAATSALELGIDVAGLDAVVLAGWPGTVASMWQRLGRAGRGEDAAVGVLVASDNPLDQYLVHHPDDLLTRPAEDAIIDATNPYLVGPHLRCAAHEAPITEDEVSRWFGDGAREVADEDVADRRLRSRAGKLHWIGRRSPAGEVNLRSIGGGPVRIMNALTGALIGTVDAGRARSQVHEGAIYLHQGVSHEIAALDLERGLAVAEPREVHHTTRPRSDTDVEIVDDMAQRRLSPAVRLSLHRVAVTTTVTGYDLLQLGSREVLASVPLDMPPLHLDTVAVLYTITEDALEGAGLPPSRWPGSLHAAEHAAIGMLPLIAMCDRWDIGGLSTARHHDTDLPSVFVYDGHQGGAGLAERSFERFGEHTAATRAVVAECGCRDGCPSCVQSPKCGNGNEPLDKAGAVDVLDVLLQALAQD